MKTLLLVLGTLCFAGSVAFLYLAAAPPTDLRVTALQWGAALAFGGLSLMEAKDCVDLLKRPSPREVKYT